MLCPVCFAFLSLSQYSLNYHCTGILIEKKEDADVEDDGNHENRHRTVRSSLNPDSDSD